ncbi:Inosine-5-monophosphate dehydrogenase (IMP dehydrogenase) (IMPDH) (IMPD) / GMP reductase [Platysternon megacephalum]|uniref:Inosine-5-monophosphate dehydrogenase (IMP dehydrogenase) (IMPDH) (IMPD) / GMP reductase n=1 Tax=Platysternon megacephalum TaxID=55544 RepID=A0A4D9DJF5_9SAUR|nr:Inosine-5-monophosphate dehydrogenase (IMP dehydrogenase) (IMPDH) (IMPD) / GMP reductase [Platysternon megacephalum]
MGQAATRSCAPCQVEYRIIVQVLNENDNKPRFLEDSVLTQNISELAALHSVVFTTRAEDKDGDTLMYVIDSTSADGKYFRIDLPNSGKIVLAKALDFETKRHLEFVVHAVEMNTKERYNSSARIRINVLDGDDQYPQFLPCNFLAHDGVSVCVSPVYTANVTEREVKVGPLHFVPGSVYAEDGDRELKAAITYAILAGTDHGRFHIDNVTGAITMLRPAESRSHTPAFSLSVMAAQVNDANKYVVTEVRVRVLAANVHPPRFSRPQYQAFVREEPGLAALVLTYSGRVLTLQAADADFPDGFNPKVRYSLTPQSNHTQLFQITPSGLLVARADRLRALQQYFLQVVARDEESGETTNTTVNVEVLRPGQAAPVDPSGAGQSQGPLDVGVLAGSLGALLLLTAAILLLLMHAMKKRQRHQQALERASLAIEKHPNVCEPGVTSAAPGAQSRPNAPALQCEPGVTSAAPGAQSRPNAPALQCEPGVTSAAPGAQSRPNAPALQCEPGVTSAAPGAQSRPNAPALQCEPGVTSAAPGAQSRPNAPALQCEPGVTSAAPGAQSRPNAPALQCEPGVTSAAPGAQSRPNAPALQCEPGVTSAAPGAQSRPNAPALQCEPGVTSAAPGAQSRPNAPALQCEPGVTSAAPGAQSRPNAPALQCEPGVTSAAPGAQSRPNAPALQCEPGVTSAAPGAQSRPNAPALQCEPGVVARDEESGETTNTTVNVEVLRPGQAAPVDPSGAGQSQGPLDVGVLAGSLGALLLLTAAILLLLMHAMKKRQRHQQALERASLAIEKHPNVAGQQETPGLAGERDTPCP